MMLDSYQKIFGKHMVRRALNRLKKGDVEKIKANTVAIIGEPGGESPEEVNLFVVRARPDFGDEQEEYRVQIKVSITDPHELQDRDKAFCSCAPRIRTKARKRNHCTHLLACVFYLLKEKDEILEINEAIDKEKYDFKVVLRKDNKIILQKREYVPLPDEWRKHFYYRDQIFHLRTNTWYSLLQAVDFVEQHCILSFDYDFFKSHFGNETDTGKIEEQAKYVDIKIDRDRIYFFFREGFEKYCTYDELTHFKKWSYPKKYKHEAGFIKEFEKKIFPVTYESDKTIANNNMKTVFSISIGFQPLFLDFLRQKGFLFNASAVTVSPESIRVNLSPNTIPRDYQTESLKTWSERGVGLIVSPSGSGKTYIGATAIATKSVKTLILVHTKDLIGQWKDTLRKFLDLKDDDIGVYASGKKENENKKVIISTYQTLQRNTAAISEFKIGLVIADECHHVPADTFQKVNDFISCPYKLGLTATPKRADKKDGGIYQFYDKIVYEVMTPDLVADKRISPVIFYSLELSDTNIKKAVDNAENGTEAARILRKMSTMSGAKHEALAKLFDNISAHGLGCIIFADRINAAEKISGELQIPFLSADLSKDDREEIFKKLRNKEVKGIVTAKLASEGVDIPNLDVVIDLIPSVSSTILLQKIGRIRRRTEEKNLGFYIQLVLSNVNSEKKWAEAAYRNFISDVGISALFSKRRVVSSPEEVNFGIKRSAKATEKRREERIAQGEKSEQEMLNFLKEKPIIHCYAIAKALNWSTGKVAKTLSRLESKGLAKKNDYLKPKRKPDLTGDVTVYFDGGCDPNPSGIATYGFCIYSSNCKVYAEGNIVGKGYGMSNNVAEYAALCAALNWLAQQGKTENVTIYGDSRLVIDQMNGVYEAHGGMYIDWYDRALSLINKFKGVIFKWIPGEENTEAHALSQKAFYIPSKPSIT